jgi:hypothetical protein
MVFRKFFSMGFPERKVHRAEEPAEPLKYRICGPEEKFRSPKKTFPTARTKRKQPGQSGRKRHRFLQPRNLGNRPPDVDAAPD